MKKPLKVRVWMLLVTLLLVLALVIYFMVPRPVIYRFNPISFTAVAPNPVEESFELEGTEFWRSGDYSYGTCTWGVAQIAPIPPGWGNAAQWDDSARREGYKVNSTPEVGAVAQSDTMSWGGHVGIVLDVSGSKLLIKDMNFGGNFGVYTERWTESSDWSNFIHLP
jgi:surface antigen